MRVLLGCLLLAACVGCAADEAPPTPVDAGPIPHGDHEPHHGGVVMMKDDLHYELILDPAGRYRLYFSDAIRTDLPAATALRASITVVRKDAPPEGVELRIDEAGESWRGEGQPVSEPAATTVRLAYTIRGEEPYWIDLPFELTATRTEAHR